MKTTAIKILALLGLLAWLPPGFLPAADEPVAHATEATADMAALETFLRLSDEELDNLIAALQRLRAMSPEERTAFGERIRAFRALPGEQRRAVREGWRQRERPDGEGWRRHVHSPDAEERVRLHRRMENLPPSERRARREVILDSTDDEAPSSEPEVEPKP